MLVWPIVGTCKSETSLEIFKLQVQFLRFKVPAVAAQEITGRYSCPSSRQERCEIIAAGLVHSEVVLAAQSSSPAFVQQQYRRISKLPERALAQWTQQATATAIAAFEQFQAEVKEDLGALENCQQQADDKKDVISIEDVDQTEGSQSDHERRGCIQVADVYQLTRP